MECWHTMVKHWTDAVGPAGPGRRALGLALASMCIQRSEISTRTPKPHTLLGTIAKLTPLVIAVQ